MSDTLKNNLLILQYNINNSRTRTMMSLLKDEKMQEYDILTIQKS